MQCDQHSCLLSQYLVTHKRDHEFVSHQTRPKSWFLLLASSFGQLIPKPSPHIYVIWNHPLLWRQQHHRCIPQCFLG